MEDKLQLDRMELLKGGESWKTKKPKQLQKDDKIVSMVEKLRKGEISTEHYLNCIIDILGKY